MKKVIKYAAIKAASGGNSLYFKHHRLGRIKAKGSFSKLKISQTHHCHRDKFQNFDIKKTRRIHAI